MVHKVSIKTFEWEENISRFIYKKILRGNKSIIRTIRILTDLILYSTILYILLSKNIPKKDIIKISINCLEVLIVTCILKEFLRRPRPYFRLDLYMYDKYDKTDPIKSIPSTHSIIAFFLFFKLYFDHNINFSLVFLTIPILRILSLNHYISDIIVSLLISIIFYLLT